MEIYRFQVIIEEQEKIIRIKRKNAVDAWKAVIDYLNDNDYLMNELDNIKLISYTDTTYYGKFEHRVSKLGGWDSNVIEKKSVVKKVGN